MPNYTEYATLIVNDQSSGPIRKINAELKALAATANALKGSLSGIRLDVASLARSTAAAAKLRTELQALAKLGAIKPTVDTSGVKAAADATARAARDAARVQREADAVAMRSLNQRLTYWRQTSPVLAQLRAQAEAEARTTRGQARAAVREAAGVRVDAESVGSRIGSAFVSLAQGAAHEIGRRIAYGLADAAKAGYTQQDIAQTKLRIQGLSEAERAAVNRASVDLARGSNFNPGQVAGLFAENLNTASGNIEGARALTASALKVADRQVELGANREKAIEDAYKFQKAGEQTGRLTDAQGNIDAGKVSAWSDFLLKSQAAIGEEFTAGFVEKAVKYLRGSKYTLNDPGLLKAFLLNEESGSTASVGINQAIKQLSGQGLQKRALNELAAQGLITLKEVKSGTDGGKKRTSTVVDKVIGEELLRSDPGAYIDKYIAPKFKERGLDINNPVDVSKYANSIASDRTSVEAISGFINRLQELKKQVDRALNNAAATDTELSKAASGLGALVAAANKGAGALGNVAKGFDSILIPAARGVGSFFDGISAYVIGPDGKQNIARSAAVTGGAGALGVAGLAAFYKLNPLTVSATQLTGSAAALRGSAAALTAAAAGKGSVANFLTPGGRGGAVAEVAADAAAVAKRGAGGLALAKRAAGGALAGAAIGAVELVFANDKAEGIGRLLGNAAGGAIGTVLGGPVGTAIGSTIGGEIGAALANTDVGRAVAEAVATAAKSTVDTFTGQPALSPYDAHANETAVKARAEVDRIKREIADVEAKRKGGYLSDADQTKRDNLSFALKGAEDRLSTYTRGAIDSIAALGNAATMSAAAITSADIAKQAGDDRRRRLDATIEERDRRTRTKEGRREQALKDGEAAYVDPRAAALHDATTAKARADAYARLTRAEKDRADYLEASKLKGPERTAALRQAAINSQSRAADERQAATAAPYIAEAARASSSAATSSAEAARLLAVAARSTGTTSGLATTAADAVRLYGATGSSTGVPGVGGPALGGPIDTSARGLAETFSTLTTDAAGNLTSAFEISAGAAAQAFMDGGNSAASAMLDAFNSGGASAAAAVASALASATVNVNVQGAGAAPPSKPPASTGPISPN